MQLCSPYVSLACRAGMERRGEYTHGHGMRVVQQGPCRRQLHIVIRLCLSLLHTWKLLSSSGQAHPVSQNLHLDFAKTSKTCSRPHIPRAQASPHTPAHSLHHPTRMQAPT